MNPGLSKLRWEGDKNMDLKETGRKFACQIYPAHNRNNSLPSFDTVRNLACIQYGQLLDQMKNNLLLNVCDLQGLIISVNISSIEAQERLLTVMGYKKYKLRLV